MKKFYCMMCLKEAMDAFEQDETGEFWAYCKSCDCWTSYPEIEPV